MATDLDVDLRDRRVARTVWIVAFVVILGACALVSAPYLRPGKSTQVVTLSSGVYDGVAWELNASWSDAGLCMSVGRPQSTMSSGIWTGQCGFDAKATNGSYWNGGIGPNATGDPDFSTAAYGPLPSDATQVRIATNEVVPSTPFPKGHGMPEGRFWLAIHPGAWPTPSNGSALDTPQPLDSVGRPVRYKAF